VNPALKLPWKKSLSQVELKEKELKSEYQKILTSREEDLEKLLSEGIKAYQNIDIAEAARFFRRIANDLKLTEHLISTKGNMSPRNKLNDLTGKQWLQHTKSWVIVDGKPGSVTKEIKDHPGSFPPELAEYFVSYFTKAGDWVFDPFMGIGSTAVACTNINRNCFGIELNSKYATFSRNRVKNQDQTDLKIEIFTEDARNTRKCWKDNHIPPINFCITSPPYWNMLKTSRGGVNSSHKQRIKEGFDEQYSDNKADLGNIDGIDDYLEDLVRIFQDFSPILAPKAYLIVILQNCRPKDGIMRPLAWNFAEKLSQHFDLRQEYIWLQDQKFAGIWGYPSVYVSNVHHHYCLVFQKKEP
jgi:DNA modification methylase